jgi:hypothetical protein
MVRAVAAAKADDCDKAFKLTRAVCGYLMAK